MKLGWRFWVLFSVAMGMIFISILSGGDVQNPYGLLSSRYIAGGVILGVLLMAWNWAVGKKAVEDSAQSDRTRHDPQKEPWLDDEYAVTDNAVQTYLDLGDPSGLGHVLQRDQELRNAFGAIEAQRPDPPRLFVNPAWLYAGRILWAVLVFAGVLTIMIGYGGSAPRPQELAFFGYPLGLVLYMSHWNRFGGPWPVRVVYAHVCLVMILLADLVVGTGVPLVLTSLPWGLGWILLGVLSAVAWSQLLWDRAGQPKPRFAYTGKPGDEVEREIKSARDELLHRLVAGLFMFIVLLVLASMPFLPDAAVAPVITGYPIIAAAFLQTKLLLMLGLMQGQGSSRRQMEIDRRRRNDALMRALASTETSP